MHLAEHGEITTTPTAPNIFRATDSPVFILDEVEEWYHRDNGMQEIINAGFNRGATVRRMEDTGKALKRKLESRRFSTFVPLCLIGNNLERILRRTVLSRALIVRMKPARADDAVEDLYDNLPAEQRLKAIARRIKRWVADNETALVAAAPKRPDGVINRMWVIWRQYLAIADQAGGKWPERAQQALTAARTRGADPGHSIQMLGDVYWVMRTMRRDRMHTGDLIAELLKLELRTWSYFGKARVPVRDTDVARLLKVYDLHPAQLWLAGRNRRGYTLADVLTAVETFAPHLLSLDPGSARYAARKRKKSSNSAADSPSGPLAPSGQHPLEPDNAGLAADGLAAEDRNLAARVVEGARELPEENQGSSGPIGPSGPASPSARDRTGNGLDPDTEAAGIGTAPAGSRCVWCGAPLDGAAAEPADDGWAHSVACHTAAQAPALESPTKPKRKRSRIKGADTGPTPEVPREGQA